MKVWCNKTPNASYTHRWNQLKQKNMKLNLIKLIIFITLPFTNILAQEKTPFLSGKVNISISQGTFECDLTLSEIPHIDDYFIRINSGMNILNMRSLKPNNFIICFTKSRNDTLSTGESKAYYFSDNTGNGKFLPESIQFKYVGKFPVVKDTIENYSCKDWKGNIAFNRFSVRSDGRQSAWYPILYDITNDKIYDKVKYDIELTCTDCNTLYINGSKPVKSKSYNFKSEIPQELTLFCGNYDFKEIYDTYFINSGLNNDEIQVFGKLINSFKRFYAQNLKIPFEQSINFIQTTPTSKRDAWMFVSFPTIMSIGWDNGLKNVVDPKYQKFYSPFIAHELGHFYFGTYKVLNSELGDMLSEGFAEFLALQLTKKLIGKDIYSKKLNAKIKNLENFIATPFAKVKSKNDYHNRELYVYNYAPLIFLAIEKEIGEQQMWKWLNKILTTQVKFTDYDFLQLTLRQSLKSDKLFEYLKAKYFESEKSLENAINTIKVQ